MMGKSFFKFFLGFVAIIGLSLAVTFVSSAYSDGNTNVWEMIANFFH
ncbi:MAG: hypothetical protein AAB428_01295 [Patescibacteria group bacterium]